MNMGKKLLVLLLIVFIFSPSFAFGASDDGWGNLKEENAPLYFFLRFLNPPVFNSPPFLILTIMFAIGTLPCIFVFEGYTRLFFLFLNLYCWARILSLFIMSSLVGQGVISP